MIIVRVFWRKVLYLIELLTKIEVFGKHAGFVGTIEFQKRGLPHLHLLLIMRPQDKPQCATDVDKYVSAMIPDKDVHPNLYEKV